MSNKPKVSIKLTFVFIKLYINGTPFVSLRRSEYNGFQAWKNDGKFSIEFYLERQTVLTEYDKYDLWKDLLDLLDKELN
jgi:hypothetical protein